MARPREFDEDKVLDAAVICFWTRGYEATSVRDLATAMGITCASLYNSFGDKRSLFRRALDHYISKSFADRARRVSALPPRQALTAFFDEVIDRSLADPECKGCLLVNSATEVAPHDPELRAAISEVFIRIEEFFRDCVTRGQAEGTIARQQTADDLARLLLGAMVGIRTLVRARPERALLEGIIRPVFALLDAGLADRRGQE